ncbi:MAG: hypothetical protein IKP28_02750 [Clostridia bacterium]|nr:hypothetical protein [Clostridia bacterium]
MEYTNHEILDLGYDEKKCSAEKTAKKNKTISMMVRAVFFLIVIDIILIRDFFSLLSTL